MSTARSPSGPVPTFPTPCPILIVDDFRFHFFTREGQEPPHIHIRKGDTIAKYGLTPVRLDLSEGFNPAELRRIREHDLNPPTRATERSAARCMSDSAAGRRDSPHHASPVSRRQPRTYPN